jgi:hypothetical protein
MDNQIHAAFGVDEIIFTVPSFFQEIRDKIFKEFLGFFGVGLNGIKKAYKVGFESFDSRPLWSDLDEGFY